MLPRRLDINRLHSDAGSQDDRKARNRLRQSRHLSRRKAGIAVADAQYDGRVLDGLIRAGLLCGSEAGDQQAINRAISLFLADEFHAYGLKKFLTR